MREILNTAGLVVNIVGTLILLKFGLPADVRPDGTVAYVAEEIEEKEVRKGATYKKLGRFGIVLLLLGFFLQLVATWPCHAKL